MTNQKVVFVAMNAKYFRFRELITKFVFKQGAVPINCLMIYGYYLYDMIPRVDIVKAYKKIVPKCDELWTFGEISDGIRDGMIIAKKNNLSIRYFDISRFPEDIHELSEDHLIYEEDVKLG